MHALCERQGISRLAGLSRVFERIWGHFTRFFATSTESRSVSGAVRNYQSAKGQKAEIFERLFCTICPIPKPGNPQDFQSWRRQTPRPGLLTFRNFKCLKHKKKTRLFSSGMGYLLPGAFPVAKHRHVSNFNLLLNEP